MGGTEEFYVGYQPEAPAAIARYVRRAIGGLAVGALGLALLLVLGQGRFPASAFEFGHLRPLTGRIAIDPVPLLLVDRPGWTPEHAAASRYLLTVPGKYGADREVRGFENGMVTLQGTLIYRDGTTMAEIVPGSIRETSGAAGERPVPPVSYGRVTLRGEIADSKCFLGVMNPGQGKPHRACAARCISGGAPPVLVVRDVGGDYVTVLLMGEDGEPINAEVLPYVAEPVEMTGALEARGDLWVLRTELATLRRVG